MIETVGKTLLRDVKSRGIMLNDINSRKITVKAINTGKKLHLRQYNEEATTMMVPVSLDLVKKSATRKIKLPRLFLPCWERTRRSQLNREYQSETLDNFQQFSGQK